MMRESEFKALLVGVPHYDDPNIGNLPCIENDIEDIDRALKSVGYRTHRQPFGRTTRTNVLDAIYNFVDGARQNDTLLIYLAGHGIHSLNKDYLVAADVSASSKRFQDGCVPIDFGEAIQESLASQVLIAVDACREGLDIPVMGIAGARNWTMGKRKAVSERRVAYVFACSPGEFARYFRGPSGRPVSLFTSAFASTLESADGSLNLRDLNFKIQEEMLRLTEQHGLPRQDLRVLRETTLDEGLDTFVLGVSTGSSWSASTPLRSQGHQSTSGDVHTEEARRPAGMSGEGESPLRDQGSFRATFSLGPLRSPLMILEGDGNAAIRAENVEVVWDDEDVVLPPEVAELKEEVAAEQERRRIAGEQAAWNGPNYAVRNLAIERRGIDETPAVTLQLCNSDYFTFLATQELDRDLGDGTTLRSRYLDNRSVWESPEFMKSSFGLNMSVTTRDDQLLVSQRSPLVGTAAGLWNSSANEGLSRSLDSQGRTPPDLFKVAARGINEELGLHEHQYDLQLIAFHVDVDTSQWGCCFWARLKDFTRDDLEAVLSRGRPDGFEHDAFEFVDFRPEPLLEYLVRPDRRESFGAGAPALFYLTLVRRYGKRRVAEALRRVSLGWP